MRAGEEKVAFAGVAGEGGGAFEFGAGFVQTVEFFEEVGADAGEEMVGLQEWLIDESVDEVEAGLWAEGHGDGHGAIQFDYGGWDKLGEGIVEGNDARPVRFFWSAGAGVTGGDGGLKCIGAKLLAEAFRAREGSKAAPDEELVPVRTVLFVEEDRFSGGVGAGFGA